jgi:hypothetical protein
VDKPRQSGASTQSIINIKRKRTVFELPTPSTDDGGEATILRVTKHVPPSVEFVIKDLLKQEDTPIKTVADLNKRIEVENKKLKKEENAQIMKNYNAAIRGVLDTATNDGIALIGSQVPMPRQPTWYELRYSSKLKDDHPRFPENKGELYTALMAALDQHLAMLKEIDDYDEEEAPGHEREMKSQLKRMVQNRRAMWK